MRFGAPATAGVLLFAVLLVIPAGVSECPDKPKDCGSAIDQINVKVGDTDLSIGAYEDSDQELKSESDGRLFLLQEDGSVRPMAHDNGTQGELNSGDHGGILIVVEDPGGATSLSFTFDETTDGIDWDTSGAITVNAPEADGHYLVPFTVTSDGKDLKFRFDVEDDQDNTASGTMNVPIDGEDPPVLIYVVIAIAALLLVLFMLLRPRAPSGDEPPLDAGPTDPDPPEPPVADDPDELEVVDVGVPTPAEDLDDEDGDDGEEADEEEPILA